jgi:hypothetical protein
MENFCPIAPGLDPILSNNYARFKPILSTVLPQAVYLDQRRQSQRSQKKLQEEIIFRMTLRERVGKNRILMKMVILFQQILMGRQLSNNTYEALNLQKVIVHTHHFPLTPTPLNHMGTIKLMLIHSG